MKKLFLCALMAVFSLASYADEGSIDVVSGDGKCLLQKDKTMSLNIDYNNAMFEGVTKDEYFAKRTEKNSNYATDFDAQSVESKQWFVKEWNGKSKASKIQESGNTDYTMNMKLSSVDLGSSAAANFGTWFNKRVGGMILSGTIDVVDNATGQVVCQIRLEQVRLTSTRSMDFKYSSEGRRRCLGMKDLAKRILKEID